MNPPYERMNWHRLVPSLSIVIDKNDISNEETRSNLILVTIVIITFYERVYRYSGFQTSFHIQEGIYVRGVNDR